MYESLAQNLFLAIWNIETRHIHVCSRAWRIYYVYCHGSVMMHGKPTRSSSKGYIMWDYWLTHWRAMSKKGRAEAFAYAMSLLAFIGTANGYLYLRWKVGSSENPLQETVSPGRWILQIHICDYLGSPFTSSDWHTSTSQWVHLSGTASTMRCLFMGQISI